MKIGILSRNELLYSTRRLLQTARVRGHQVSVIDTLTVPIKVAAGHRRDLPPVVAIVPRIGTSITFYGLAVVRQFEAQGVVTTASSTSIARSRDKLRSLQLMREEGLPIPNTTAVGDSDDVWTAVDLAGGIPVVIKLIRGTQGRGVFLARELKTVAAVLDTVHRHREQVLIQEFIREAQGSDIRVIVVGNRCVAAMKRTAADGEFRSNLHRGGTAEPYELNPVARDLAVRAARAHGLGVAGVDLIESDRGPLLLEVNSSPGLEGIETTTGQDVASEIVRYLEQEKRRTDQSRRQKRRSRTRYRR